MALEPRYRLLACYCRELCHEIALASPRMSRNDTAIEVHAGATMGRASFALLRAYPNLGGLFLQEAEQGRLSIAVERVEAGYSPNVGPEQRDNGNGVGAVRPLHKQLSAVATEADPTSRFTLAISALGLVLHDGFLSKNSRPGVDDTQQKLLRHVRATLQHIFEMLVRGAHAPDNTHQKH